MAASRSRYLADFDSATAMLRALAAFLHGRDFPHLGLSAALRPVAIASNWLPSGLREEVYKLGGYFETVAPRKLAQVKDAEIAAWVTELYPKRRYPVVLIGSSNGALVYLAAALGAPWLPQTFLIPVQQKGIGVDEPREALEFSREHGRRLLEANPDLQLHHMHDANQDRLMTHYMTYFRIKRRRLGEAYARFLVERLAPGGVVALVDCRYRWPITTVGPRHVFQHGGAGGITPQEYLEGSPRMAAWFAVRPRSPALGCACARRRKPRGRVGFRRGARGGRRAPGLCAGPSRGPHHVRAPRGPERAGRRALSLVVLCARLRGQPCW